VAEKKLRKSPLHSFSMVFESGMSKVPAEERKTK
jgi:hypothetical protein